MTGTTGGAAPPGAAGEMNAALLPIAFPEFWFGQLTHRRHRPRWVAVCKDDTGTGLYSLAAADLGALTAALTLDRAWRAGRSSMPAPPPGPPQRPQTPPAVLPAAARSSALLTREDLHRCHAVGFHADRQSYRGVDLDRVQQAGKRPD